MNIPSLLEPFLDRELTAHQLEQISTYIDLLLRWNARINLTAIRTPEEIVTRHFGESFFLARHLFPQPSIGQPPEAREQSDLATRTPRVLDLGSGAGFPALPIKIWDPEIHLTMIESNHKKATFLREVTRALTFTNVNVIPQRAEAVEGTTADVVTFRAVEKFDQILRLAPRFLAPQGRIALLIGSSQLASLSALPFPKWEALPVPQSNTRILALCSN